MIDLLDQLAGIGGIAVVKVFLLSVELKRDAICGPGAGIPAIGPSSRILSPCASLATIEISIAR
jgi:hypothetical protein